MGFKFKFKCDEIRNNDQQSALHKMDANDDKKSTLKSAISDEFICNEEMRVCLCDVVVRSDMDFDAPIIEHLCAGTPIVVEEYVVVCDLTRAMISSPVNGWITAQKVEENGSVRAM